MTTRPARWLLAMLLPLAIIAAGCGSDDDDSASDTTAASGEGGGACSEATAPDDAPAITIGAQDFGESAILAEIYRQCLDAAGYDVSIQEVGGFRDLELAAFDGGDINLAPEYAASMLEALNDQAGEATADAQETADKLKGYLSDLGLVALTPSEAVDTNALVVTKETADKLDLTSLSDLADHPELVLGGPADCETNAFCLPGLKSVYGVDLSAGFTPLEPAAVAPALDAGEIDVALLFSTDSRIVTNDYVLLEDDKGMLAADNVLPVLTTELADVEGLSDLLDAISESLTTSGLTELNRRFDVDVEDADKIAESHLTDAGLL
ncbi:MAG TPA: ABC transporter substrate-binding protein [Acidimicrobiales bacterium]|nr:ABC transporter substrate-binding protein [Acidimicrobiales bacterium]